MDFAINLGNLILIWTLVIVAIVFTVGTLLTMLETRKRIRSKTVLPRLTSGQIVSFRDGRTDKPFIVTTVHFDGSSRTVSLQDLDSYTRQNRTSDLP